MKHLTPKTNPYQIGSNTQFLMYVYKTYTMDRESMLDFAINLYYKERGYSIIGQ